MRLSASSEFGSDCFAPRLPPTEYFHLSDSRGIGEKQ